MFKWINRRRKLRREDDQRLRMEEVIRKKKEAVEEAIRTMQRFTFNQERRYHSIPVEVERRGAH